MKYIEIGVVWEDMGHPRLPAMSPLYRAHRSSYSTDGNYASISYRYQVI